MQNTNQEFVKVIENSRDLFSNKLEDYGSAWRILRLPSLTDQIYIKANRIRTLQEVAKAQVEESVEEEFRGILNYAIIALIQLELGVADQADLSQEEALKYYDKMWKRAYELMQKKNHDYGEAWRDMRVSSITDLILQKILRIKQIEDNQGKTKVSEGLEANYYDILNYAVFALILLDNSK